MNSQEAFRKAFLKDKGVMKMHLEGLTLYYKNTCPYCQKVLGFMARNELSLDMCDITMPGHLDNLLRIGGKNQVPCLIIDGEALYESADIITYLDTFV